MVARGIFAGGGITRQEIGRGASAPVAKSAALAHRFEQTDTGSDRDVQ